MFCFLLKAFYFSEITLKLYKFKPINLWFQKHYKRKNEMKGSNTAQVERTLQFTY